MEMRRAGLPRAVAAAAISVVALRVAAARVPAAASTAAAGRGSRSQSFCCPSDCPSAGCCSARPSWRLRPENKGGRGCDGRASKCASEALISNIHVGDQSILQLVHDADVTLRVKLLYRNISQSHSDCSDVSQGPARSNSDGSAKGMRYNCTARTILGHFAMRSFISP